MSQVMEEELKNFLELETSGTQFGGVDQNSHN
jgi:hypothetical protein